MNLDGNDTLALQAEVKRLLADALAAEDRHTRELERRDEAHVVEIRRRDELHVAEIDRRDGLHVAETQRRSDLHEHELEMIRTALETRDIIGQAMGVIMAAMGCSPDEAFALIRTQSQHQNRKLVEVAAEIASRATRAQPPARS